MERLLATATDTVSSGISWGLALPTDILILIVGSVVLAVAFLALGLRRAIAFILALEIAAVLYRTFPYFDSLGEAESSLSANLALFAALTIALTFLLSRPLCIEYSSTRVYQLLQAYVLGLSALSLLLAFSYHIITLEGLYQFGPLITALFSPDQFFFWWLIAPLVLLWPLSRLE